MVFGFFKWKKRLFFEKKLRIFEKLGETGLCACEQSELTQRPVSTSFKKIRNFSKRITNNTGYFFIRRIFKSVTYKIRIKIKERIVLPAGTWMLRFIVFLVKQCCERHCLRKRRSLAAWVKALSWIQQSNLEKGTVRSFC